MSKAGSFSSVELLCLGQWMENTMMIGCWAASASLVEQLIGTFQARLKSANLGIDPGLVPGLLRIEIARSS
jgi:hypothetical protein